MPDMEKVIKWLEYDYLPRVGAYRKDCKQGCDACIPMHDGDDYCDIDMLCKVLSLLKEQEWHMLTEDDDGIIHGLPGDDGQYLMTDGKDIWIDDYVDGVEDGIILDSGRDIREITAWMYKPELPKKDRR